MRALLVFLTSLFCASMAAAEGPTTYVWQLSCGGDDGWTFGPWGAPDACQAMQLTVAQTCERPLLPPETHYDAKAGGWRAVQVPNPAFVRIADVCKTALNGRDCACGDVGG